MNRDDMANPRLTLSVDVTDLSDADRLRFTEEVTDLLGKYLDGQGTEEASAAGWTQETVQEALLALERDNGWVQAGVIRAAIDNGGTVSREQVYAIGQYESTRMLRGFTRPVNRVVSRMRAKGTIPATAVDLLAPVYNGGVQATAFRVPDELLNLSA
ncbi:hypothetical protein [Saccharothrix sp. HUAS TT1]|uniref:hypothetical protein n=1 Tax=unclassified Saccharothrix TaxID=2593673 RepID=UPI00345BF2C0